MKIKQYFQQRFSSSTFVRNKGKKVKKEECETYFFLEGEVIYGIYPISLALKAKKRTFHSIYYNNNNNLKSGNDRRKEVLKKAEGLGIPILGVSPSALESLSCSVTKEGGGVHQGLVADVSPLKTRFWKKEKTEEEAGREKGLSLFIPDVGDPHNLGAIIRSSYYLGVNQVFTSLQFKNAIMNPVVSKTSSGVLEIFQPMIVRDSSEFLEYQSKIRGCEIIGADLSESLSSSSSSTKDKSGDVRDRILILGSEGSGISKDLKRFIDRYIGIIPGRTDIDPLVDSLNVSVASALIIQNLLQKSTIK